MSPAHGISVERACRAMPRIADIAILAGMLVLVLALVFGVHAAGARIDAASRAREVRLVSNGLKLRAEEVRRSMIVNTIWDDAVRRLDTRFEPAWAEVFISQSFWQIDGYQLAFVLDGAGDPIFATDRTRRVDPKSFAPFSTALKPMLQQIRAREAARGPGRLVPAAEPHEIDAGTVAWRGDRAYLLAAALVQADHSSGARASARAPIVVVGEAIDDAFVARMARRYLVEDLHILPGGASAPAGEASTPVQDAAGRTVVRLAWRPQSPAAHLADVARPPLVVAFIALATAAALLIRRERRRNLALVAATRDAHVASDAKSAFLATMSHEIRTPLNGVLGMAQAMAMEPLSEAQRGRLDVVRQSGEALLAILNDVLDLSKIEAGKLELESIDFDLAEVMQGAYAAFTHQANSKGLSFSLDVRGAEGTYRGDPTRIRQILYNLISNALKFTAVGEIRVWAEAMDDGLKLSVSDTGEGVAADKLAALFTKFTQADASTTRRFGGTGLGLSICRELAALMGGTIEATSSPGAGSVFTLTLKLPRVGEARAPAVLPSPETAGAVHASRTMRVLVAEDNQMNQLVVRTLLHQVGVDAVVVANGALAVEAWEGGAWDLILMDAQMPVMDGLHATRAIRALEAASGRARTPIVALTANAMAHQVAHYLDAGMDAHVAKPIEAAALFAVLARFVPDEDQGQPYVGAPLAICPA